MKEIILFKLDPVPDPNLRCIMHITHNVNVSMYVKTEVTKMENRHTILMPIPPPRKMLAYLITSSKICVKWKFPNSMGSQKYFQRSFFVS